MIKSGGSVQRSRAWWVHVSQKQPRGKYVTPEEGKNTPRCTQNTPWMNVLKLNTKYHTCILYLRFRKYFFLDFLCSHYLVKWRIQPHNVNSHNILVNPQKGRTGNKQSYKAFNASVYELVSEACGHIFTAIICPLDSRDSATQFICL